MIHVLQVVSVMDAGGMENYIMNMYRMIDRRKIQFDFLVHHEQRGIFEDEIEALGGSIYRCTVLDDKNIIKYIRDLDNLFENHKEYRIVHGHLSSLAFIYLGIAKKHHIPYRIAHSHGAGNLKSLKGYAKFFMFKGAKIFANKYYACSSEAGKYLFGNTKFELLPNGINPERFVFKEANRTEIRRKYEVENKFVIGHVGRFNLQKNHTYLLKIFKLLHDRYPESRLLLLGTGELENAVKKETERLKLSDSVIFAGIKKDCEKYYHAMDAFVLPSLFEGLPVTGIEAQYAGLPCIFSDEISKEVKITDNIRFIGIKERDKDKWVSALIELSQTCCNRRAKILCDIYDVNLSSVDMQKRYMEMGET